VGTFSWAVLSFAPVVGDGPGGSARFTYYGQGKTNQNSLDFAQPCSLVKQLDSYLNG
jgi:hypothetical protein